jgi:glucokinase
MKKPTNKQNDEYILLFDVGGTWTKVATAQNNKILSKKIFETKDFKLEDIKLIVENSNLHFSLVLIACAGPINNGTCKMTNADLVFDERSLSNLLKVRVVIMNDLAAIAYKLKSKYKSSLIIGLGTGLGVSIISANGEIIPSEEGHLLIERDFFLAVPEFRGINIPQYEHLLSGKKNILIKLFNKSFISLIQEYEVEDKSRKKKINEKEKDKNIWFKKDRFTDLYMTTLNMFVDKMLMNHQDVKIKRIIFTGGVTSGNKVFMSKYIDELRKRLKSEKKGITEIKIINDEFLGTKGILNFYNEKQKSL